MFVENVAVVLLVAPVALSLADKLKISPVPLLIGIAVSSNLQGTATMIGDPPSMILAGHLRMGFWDFFAYQGQPGIFFAVEIGMLASLAVLGLVFRKHREKSELIPKEQARSWVPAILLGFLVVGLSFATTIDPEFAWFAGVYTLVLAAAALLWFRLVARWGSSRKLVAALDWDTTFFLIGVFVLVGGLSDSGWMDKLSAFMAGSVGGSVALAFAMIVVFSVIVSGFVDNVPYLLVMIPVAQIPAAAFASLLLRGNLWIAAVSTLVSNPFTYGPLYYFAYRLGARLIGAPALPARSGADFIPPEGFVEWSAYVWQWVSGIGQPLLLGMLLMAVSGAALGYGLAQFGWRMKILDKRRRQLHARMLRARAGQAPLGTPS